MLKEILTGSKLKEEIAHLQDEVNLLKTENEQLASTLKKYTKDDQRLKDAITEKQSAHRELKVAKQQIESLLMQTSKIAQDNDGAIKTRHTHNHTKNGFDEILSQLSTITSMERSLVTIYLKPGGLTGGLDHAQKLKDIVSDETLTLFDSIESSTGKVLFHSQIMSLALLPPLPIGTSDWMMGERFFTDMVRSVMRERSAGVIIGRSGTSIVGVVGTQGDVIDASIIRSSVKGKHTKGGWSQKRFEHLRDEDVSHHINKVREHMLPLFEEHAPDIIVAVGDTNLIDRMVHGINIPVVMKSIDVKEDTKPKVAVDNALWWCRTYNL